MISLTCATCICIFLQTKLSGMDYERLKSVLHSLPVMSKDIVDDTIHEKVLSYLCDYLKQNSMMVDLFLEWGALTIIEDSLKRVDDYRIQAIAFRVLGYILKSDKRDPSPAFEALQRNYAHIIQKIIDSIHAEEALIRCSSIECLTGIITHEEGAKWFLNTDKAPNFVAVAFNDSSTYVISEISLFLVSIINGYNTSTPSSSSSTGILLSTLLDKLDLVNQVKAVLIQRHQPDQRFAALELCWAIVNARTKNAERFLRDSGLLHNFVDFFWDPDRIVCFRTIEIISAVFDLTPDPFTILVDSSTHPYDSQEDQSMLTFNFMMQRCLSLVATENVNDILTFGSILDALLKLANSTPDRQNLYILSESYWISLAILRTVCSLVIQLDTPEVCSFALKIEDEIVAGKWTTHFNESRRGKANRKAVACLFLRIVYDIFSFAPATIQAPIALDILLMILSNKLFNTDPKVLKGCLKLLPKLLIYITVHDPVLVDQSTTFSKIIERMTKLLDDPNTDCRRVQMLLETFEVMLTDDLFGQLLLEKSVAVDLAEALNLKLYDVSWDIRDSSVEFIGRLFNTTQSNAAIAFAIKHELPTAVIDKLNDSEAYVRASCLHAAQSIMTHNEGWSFIQNHNLQHLIPPKLQSLMYDSEAFVRRAVMEVIVFLMADRQCGTILFEGKEHSVSAEAINRIMNDADWEVRVRGCRFLYALWEYSTIDQIVIKKAKLDLGIDNSNDFSSWFFRLHGDKLLLEAISDSSRFVRSESLSVLKQIRADFETQTNMNSTGLSINTGKRSIRSTSLLSAPEQAFYDSILAINFERIAATISVEHLYQEALDVDNNGVDSSMMMDVDKPNDGNNVLDCY